MAGIERLKLKSKGMKEILGSQRMQDDMRQRADKAAELVDAMPYVVLAVVDSGRTRGSKRARAAVIAYARHPGAWDETRQALLDSMDYLG